MKSSGTIWVGYTSHDSCPYDDFKMLCPFCNLVGHIKRNLNGKESFQA
jgi:hypothetical protein